VVRPGPTGPGSVPPQLEQKTLRAMIGPTSVTAAGGGRMGWRAGMRIGGPDRRTRRRYVEGSRHQGRSPPGWPASRTRAWLSERRACGVHIAIVRPAAAGVARRHLRGRRAGAVAMLTAVPPLACAVAARLKNCSGSTEEAGQVDSEAISHDP
jgi:hypothetical protein